MKPPTTIPDANRPAWADAPWTLHVLVICLVIAATIKTFVPESNLLLNFLASSIYGFSIRYGCKLLYWILPDLPFWLCLAIATPIGIAIGASVDLYVIGAEVRLGRNVHALSTWQYIMASLIFSIAAMYFVYMRGRLLQTRADLQQEQLQRVNQAKLLAESQLRALQSQIEPHFIFNTLANVQALIATDPRAAQSMLESFTRLLRLTLKRSREGDTTFGQEVEIVQEYLSIQRQRLGERLRYRVDVAEPLRALPFPPLLLQPLVENAVKHGIEPSIDGGEVTVSAQNGSDKLVIQVRDTGRGFAENAEHGIGLANVRERLTNLYGSSATLTLAENPQRGICATVEVPLAALH